MYIISKQKYEHKEKLVKEARDTFVALGGNCDLTGTISTIRIKQILKGEFELNDDLEKILTNIYQDRDEITFDDFIKFFH